MYKNRGFATIKYNAFKSPIEINLEDKGRIDYEFSILKNRYASFYGSTDIKDKQPIQKYYSSDKAIEIIVDQDKTQVITYVTGDPYSANYIKIEELQGGKTTVKNYYLHRDNQGTIVGISDAAGAIVEQRSFDAWGNLQEIKIREVEGKIDDLGWNRQLLLDRGYTGHEHLYTVGLIHMNGRIYDPKLRRFLSPDNYVQDNTNTQNYNRYGYVLNNPLLYIDPSGEEIGLFGSMLIGAAVAIVSTVVMNAINDVPVWYGLGKATVFGAAAGASSYGIGAAVSAANLDVIVQAAMHGASAGQMSLLSGGDFKTGFISGAVASLVGSGIGSLGPEGAGYLNSGTTQALMIVGGGLSGGISSSIAGGNFWQGMRQGLITAGLNHVAHMELDNGEKDPPVKTASAFTSFWDDFVKFLADFTGGSQVVQIHQEAMNLSAHSDGSTDWAAFSAYSLMMEKVTNPGNLEMGRGIFGRSPISKSPASSVAKNVGSLVQRNRAAGNLFRDQLAEGLRAEGRTIYTEVYKKTPFGKRYMDLDVWHNGVNLGRIEAKVGGSRYHSLQRLKDAWLDANGYPVQLVRKPKKW